MELNRNHWYLFGLVFLFFGIQFRVVDAFVLSPELTNVLAERTGNPLAAVSSVTTLLGVERPMPVRKTLKPPEWLGWCLMSVGSVLVLHSLSMPKPAG